MYLKITDVTLSSISLVISFYASKFLTNEVEMKQFWVDITLCTGKISEDNIYITKPFLRNVLFYNEGRN